MGAAQEGHERAVELLLQRGAEVNKQNSDGCTALMFAAGVDGGEEGRKVKNSQARTGHQRVMGGRGTDDDGTREVMNSVIQEKRKSRAVAGARPTPGAQVSEAANLSRNVRFALPRRRTRLRQGRPRLLSGAHQQCRSVVPCNHKPTTARFRRACPPCASYTYPESGWSCCLCQAAAHGQRTRWRVQSSLRAERRSEHQAPSPLSEARSSPATVQPTRTAPCRRQLSTRCW